MFTCCLPYISATRLAIAHATRSCAIHIGQTSYRALVRLTGDPLLSCHVETDILQSHSSRFTRLASFITFTACTASPVDQVDEPVGMRTFLATYCIHPRLSFLGTDMYMSEPGTGRCPDLFSVELRESRRDCVTGVFLVAAPRHCTEVPNVSRPDAARVASPPQPTYTEETRNTLHVHFDGTCMMCYKGKSKCV